ncbi:MAG: molybdopterin cofactor-binding domain-containing protein [Isosphaerales bacterium]
MSKQSTAAAGFEPEAPGLEPERYELHEEPAYRFDLDRRGFLKSLGGGILVLYLLDAANAQQPGAGRRRGGARGGQPAPQDIGAWLHIGEDGQINVYTGKAEVGQNIRTSLTQIVAEELHAAPGSIRLVMADTQLTPFDMGTFGSRTTPDMSRRLARIAAAARELLVDFAAETWKTDRALLSAVDGAIVHTTTKQSLDFGKLTKGRKLAKTVADSSPANPPEKWTVAGHSAPKVDGRASVTGKHQYASDIRLPGMWYGKVLRSPSFGATLASIDLGAAKAMADVVVVRDRDFVGVVAPSESQAARALAAIKADWKPGPRISGKDLFDDLKRQGRQARAGRAGSSEPSGPIKNGLDATDIRLEQTYTIAYIAHAPLEPRAAVARWEDGKLTVWTGTQRPFGVRGDLAGAFGVSADAVRVIVPDTGAGYGGKHTGEAAIEAARLAREAGKPVKLVWTREEEFTWAYFRPAGVIEISSGARRDGTLTAWEFHNYNSGGSGVRTLYDVPNQSSAFHQTQFPLRQGSYRALASTANHFAREVHMDELAHAAHLDPLEFRLKNLKDDKDDKDDKVKRLRAVIQAAAGAFGWGRKSEADHGIGIAAGSEKGSFIATCAEVAVDRSSGRVQVVRAVSAFECGAIVNPDHLKNQVEGAMMMGLGGALFEAVEFDDGRILNPRFSRYRVPRFRDTPRIEVILLDRKDLPPAGAGETPIVAIAPAIGNAIFDATGVRLRSLPLAPQGVKV